MDRRLAVVFAAGLLLGAALAAWGVLQMTAPDKPDAVAVAPVKAEAVKVSAPAPKAQAAPTPKHAHVACPASAVIAAAGKDDGMMRLRSEPDTAAEISQLILSGKESAAAGRPRDAELSFLAACKAADQLAADASEPTDARYQLARHYAHHVLVGNAAPVSRAELLRRAELLYADAEQAYRSRFGAEHEKTRFASEGLAALKQSPAVAVAATATTAAKPAPAAKATPVPVATPVVPAAAAPKAVAAAEPRPTRPAATPRPAVVERAAPEEVAEAPRPRRAPRVVEPEPEVIEAPVRQATGTSRSDSR